MTRPFFDDDNPTNEAGHWMHFLLQRAVSEIDQTFGKGYAKANPALVSSYLQAAASLMSLKELSGAVERGGGSATEIAYAIDRAEFFKIEE